MKNKQSYDEYVNQLGKVQDAMHWQPYKDQRVECLLCPRRCKIRNNKTGSCRVRGSIDGVLKTYNFGMALTATEEFIETEAVNHYRPGARILSMGNVGCMMNCSFCQNWETSQVKYLDHKAIQIYSPQQVIDICNANQIKVLSWTYNDPVVWHEFVLATSKLAQANGIRTLYKSAFYIEKEPVEELIDCIDIFSISLKSMSERFYRRITKAKLQPVLDRIIQVQRSQRHLEISQLIVPELNDNDEDIKRTVSWVRTNLGIDVPLHFVAFHPAYKYSHVERTPVSTLQRARQLAFDAGIKHVYLGNVNKANVNDTTCVECGLTLIKRYGLTASVENLNGDGTCRQCGCQSLIKELWQEKEPSENIEIAKPVRNQLTFKWSASVQAIHIVRSGDNAIDLVKIQPFGVSAGEDQSGGKSEYQPLLRILGPGLDRFIVCKRSDSETGIVMQWHSENQFNILPVLDRAHFPVLVDQSSIGSYSYTVEKKQVRVL